MGDSSMAWRRRIGVTVPMIAAVCLLPGAAQGATPAPPRNTHPPTVAGVAQVGATLVAKHGTWTGASKLHDEWVRCSAAGCAVIPGATTTRYTLTATDVGRTVYFREYASNAGGSSTWAVSHRTAIVTTPSASGLTASPSPAVAGQTVTLTAAIASSNPRVLPTGSLTFTAGGGALPGCGAMPVSATGPSLAVSCLATFPAGTQTLSAAFTPTAGALLIGSTTAPVTLEVTRAPTATALSAPTVVVLGDRARYTARVTAPGGNGTLSPSGAVSFIDGRHTVSGCGRVPVSAGTATCTTVRYRRLDRHRIAAAYGGDGNYLASGSSSAAVTMRAPAPTGLVTALMDWSFHFRPTYTLVSSLAAQGLSSGVTVRTSCHGRGCAFHTRTRTIRTICRFDGRHHARHCTTRRSLDLRPLFARHRLRSHAWIAVSLSHPHWLGKYYRFDFRAGRRPLIHTACLAAGGTQPGVGCRRR